MKLIFYESKIAKEKGRYHVGRKSKLNNSFNLSLHYRRTNCCDHNLQGVSLIINSKTFLLDKNNTHTHTYNTLTFKKNFIK